VLGARAGEVMWYVYGLVSLLIGMCFFFGLTQLKGDKYDKIDYIIIIVLGLICVFAGLDWMNLIPEV